MKGIGWYFVALVLIWALSMTLMGCGTTHTVTHKTKATKDSTGYQADRRNSKSGRDSMVHVADLSHTQTTEHIVTEETAAGAHIDTGVLFKSIGPNGITFATSDSALIAKLYYNDKSGLIGFSAMQKPVNKKQTMDRTVTDQRNISTDIKLSDSLQVESGEIKASQLKTAAATNDEDKKSTTVPWWVWLCIGATVLIGIVLGVFYLRRKAVKVVTGI